MDGLIDRPTGAEIDSRRRRVEKWRCFKESDCTGRMAACTVMVDVMASSMALGG